jgi:putative FmdB family regulatory protein
MPTYDYTCSTCHKRFDVFLTYQEYGVKPVACLHCGSSDIRRRAPRVRVLKSDESRLSQMADPALLSKIDEDPKALGHMMREMGSGMGEELPPEFGEVVDRLEAGQSPDEISSAIPDLGAEGGGSDSGQDLSFDD